MAENDDKQAIWQRKAEEEGAKTLTEFVFRWLEKGFDWGKNEVAFRAATRSYIRTRLNR
jgi:hypothetical protein